MKTHTIKTYSIKELKEQFPKAYARALKDWQENQTEIFWTDEIMDSLKGLFKAAGITLKDWTIGAYNVDFVKFELDESIGNLTGKRAFAWIENNLYHDLRITRKQYLENRKSYFGYGDEYRIGKIKPCPFTGVCFDEDFIDYLNQSIKDGETISEALHDLANRAGDMMEEELTNQQSEEYFLDHAEANQYEFLESGKQY